MKATLGTLFLVAVLGSACSTAVQDVNFCRVIASAPQFVNRTFRTEITVVPSQHGWFAFASQCSLPPVPGIYRAPVMHFTPSSFEGSAALRRLNDEIERASRMRNDQGVLKAVAARITARIEAFEPPQDRYLLRVLDTSDVRLVDEPMDIVSPSAPRRSDPRNSEWHAAVPSPARSDTL